MTFALVPPPPSPARTCSVERALAILGGKWKPRLLQLLAERTHRFREVERRLPHVSRKVLVEQLRHLEASGLVQRTVYPEVPSRVEYALTERGRSALPLLRALREFGEGLMAERGPESATLSG